MDGFKSNILGANLTRELGMLHRTMLLLRNPQINYVMIGSVMSVIRSMLNYIYIVTAQHNLSELFSHILCV